MTTVPDDPVSTPPGDEPSVDPGAPTPAEPGTSPEGDPGSEPFTHTLTAGGRTSILTGTRPGWRSGIWGISSAYETPVLVRPRGDPMSGTRWLAVAFFLAFLAIGTIIVVISAELS